MAVQRDLVEGDGVAAGGLDCVVLALAVPEAVEAARRDAVALDEVALNGHIRRLAS